MLENSRRKAPRRLRPDERRGDVRLRFLPSALGLFLVGCIAAPGENGDAGRPLIEKRDAFFDAARPRAGLVVAVGKWGKILRSEDEGRSWHLVSSPVTQDLLSLSFRDESHGAVVGTGGTYLESMDGGSTWAARPLGTDRQLITVRFASGLGLVVGAFGTLLRSESGGDDWKPVDVDWQEILPEISDTLGAVEPYLFDVAICDASTVFLVGEYGLVLSSRDAGLTWRREHGGALLDRHLFAAVCLDDGSVVAAGQGGEILVRDASDATWLPAESPVPYDLYGLATLGGASSLVAVGDLGTLLVSETGGRSFRKLAFGLPEASAPSAPRYRWISSAVPAAELLLVGESGIRPIPYDRLHTN